MANVVKTIIIPKGTINSNENAVIEIPASLSRQRTLIVRAPKPATAIRGVYAVPNLSTPVLPFPADPFEEDRRRHAGSYRAEDTQSPHRRNITYETSQPYSIPQRGNATYTVPPRRNATYRVASGRAEPQSNVSGGEYRTYSIPPRDVSYTFNSDLSGTFRPEAYSSEVGEGYKTYTIPPQNATFDTFNPPVESTGIDQGFLTYSVPSVGDGTYTMSTGHSATFNPQAQSSKLPEEDTSGPYLTTSEEDESSEDFDDMDVLHAIFF